MSRKQINDVQPIAKLQSRIFHGTNIIVLTQQGFLGAKFSFYEDRDNWNWTLGALSATEEKFDCT